MAQVFPSASAVFQAPAVLASGQTHTTLYVADPQFEHLGPRSFIDNPLIDYFIPSADRNLVSTSTAPVYVDTLLSRVLTRLGLQNDQRVKIQVLGDVPDTPCSSELAHFEKVLERHPVSVEGYDRGNHSSANAYGVVNIRSRIYRFFAKLFRKDWLKEDVCQSCGDCGNFLTTQETMRGMHRILHRHHPNPPTVEQINTPVSRTNGKVAVVETTPVPLKPENHAQIVQTFWKPTPEADGRARYWEALVNFQIGDVPVDQRKTAVTPFYIQACEEARFALEDGSQVPVYTISLDSLDNTHALAVLPGVSELQVRLVEAFIQNKLAENPNARFKLSSHFSSIRILKHSDSEAAKEAFRGLLSREEVVLFSGGHSHERELTNLRGKLDLGRKTDLWEIVVPSLVDYHPSQKQDGKTFQDARALVIETMRIDKDVQGRPVLKLDLEYQGLDREDLNQGVTPEVEKALADYQDQHSYQRAKQTISQLKRRHIWGFLRRRLNQVGEFFTAGLVPFRWEAFKRFWKRVGSPIQATLDNFTVVSTVQMFNEAEHYIPFLKSVAHFMQLDATEPGEMAAQAQVAGVLTLLEGQYAQRRPQFEAAVARGTTAAELKTYNDLYARGEITRLPSLFLQMKRGGQARAFAVLAGLAASREEYEYHRGRPSKVPNKIPTIDVPVG